METEPRRLHRLSWLFITSSSAKGLIFPAFLLLFVSASNPWMRFELIGLLFLIPTLIGALIKQQVYNYRFADDELIVRDGVLTKKERHIPFDRIHNIAIVRNPFHRILGVASARIETAGGGKPEAVMQVLSLAAADELRQRTMNMALEWDTSDETGQTELEPITLLSLSTGELVRMGLISGKGILVFAAAAGALWQLQWWEIGNFDLEPYLKGGIPNALSAHHGADSLAARVLQLLLAIVLVVLAIRLVSIIWHVVKYHGFVIQRMAFDLRMEFGLLTTVSSLLPPGRIQLITARTSFLHRCFGRASIELEAAGSSEEGSDLDQQLSQSGVKSRQYLAPILPRDQTASFLLEIQPHLNLDLVEWQSLSPRALGRIMKRSALIYLALTLLLATIMTVLHLPVHALQAFWLLAIMLPFRWVRARGWLGYSAWGLTDHAVFYRCGWLSRTTSIVAFDKIQTVTLRASPFDRRRQMASVSVDTAGASELGPRIDIPYLDSQVAEEILRRLHAEAAATEFDW